MKIKSTRETIETIEQWLKSDDWRVRAAAMRACIGRTGIPAELIERGLEDTNSGTLCVAMDACEGKKFPIETIERWLKSDDWYVRAAAMRACIGRTDIPVELIERGLKDRNSDSRYVAIDACEGKKFPIEIIEQWLKSDEWYVRVAAMRACIGRTDIPVELIERGLMDNDNDPDIRRAAMDACKGKKFPIKTIKRWLKSDDWYVRAAAMRACIGRTDIPVELIERGLEDTDEGVWRAATEVCKNKSFPTKTILYWLESGDPFIRSLAEMIMDSRTQRTFNPPEKVYKKCCSDVIVVAEIPDDAAVRGTVGRKCRASKAKIIDVIGTYYGEKVGVSSYDGTITYFIGDEIEIENFDYSNERCSAGFHFFCTLDEAQNYHFF